MRSNRIVEEILSSVCKKRIALREASYEDAENIFDLANDDLVRENSFKPDKIEWEHHLEWIRVKLAESNKVFFIVEYSGRFAGQVRFDLNPSEKNAIIGFSLVKAIRSLRMSSLIISKSIKKLLEKHKSLKLVKAYIKAENIVSIKSFKRAGFVFFEHTTINGCDACVYVRESDKF